MQVEEHIDGRAKAFRLFVKEDGKEIGHIRLYLIYNDFHEGPYGLFEYIFVDPDYRGRGIAQQLFTLTEHQALVEGSLLLWSIPRKTALSSYTKFGFETVGGYIETETADANIYVKKFLPY
mgnify:CR=1 FL=1